MYRYSLWQTSIVILDYSGRTLLGLLPYILAGVIVGEVLKLNSWTKTAYAWTSRSPSLSILAASLAGMASPLCTYGTVPVMLQLYRAGVHPAPLAAFLAVSSMMNPQLFIFTWGWLGADMALLRAGSVLVFGLGVGFCLYRLPLPWAINRSALAEEARGEILARRAKRWKIAEFARDVWNSLTYVGFYVVIGVLAGAALEVALPDAWLQGFFVRNSFWSLLASALAGIPLYACGGGILPVVRELMQNGMSRGAVLAFLFVGPATRIAPLAALAALLRPRFVVAYLIVVLAFALLLGMVFP